MSRRRMLLEQGELPSGYKRCKYLENTGTQYIDTNLYPTQTMGICVTFLCTVNNRTDNIIIGTRFNSQDTRFWIDLDLYKCQIGAGYGSYSQGAYRYNNANINTIYMVKLNYLNDGDISVNGISFDKTAFHIGNFVQQSFPIAVFCGNVYGSKKFFLNGKIYDLAISDNNKNVLNFIPALDRNGRPCMYDTVTQKPFYNQGTGEFLYELEE